MWHRNSPAHSEGTGLSNLIAVLKEENNVALSRPPSLRTDTGTCKGLDCYRGLAEIMHERRIAVGLHHDVLVGPSHQGVQFAKL
jgi:hypothetical protein